METTFNAPGISCQGCANTIEKALGTIPDVSRVSVDVAKKTVTVSHGDRVGRETLEDALVRAGYPAASETDPVRGRDGAPATAAGRREHAGIIFLF
jgi:copper chaperone CopZ